MSRIGKLPIEVPAGVEVSIKDCCVEVKKGSNVLEAKIPYGISVNIAE